MKNLKRVLKNKKGFTLIELIVVIAILAILAAIMIPRFSGFREKAASSQALVHAKQIATAGDALIAEDPDAATLDVDDVIQIAGEDDITGDISDASITDGRYLFTYTLTYEEVEYTVVRNATGEFDVTW